MLAFLQVAFMLSCVIDSILSADNGFLLKKKKKKQTWSFHKIKQKEYNIFCNTVTFCGEKAID